MWDYKTLNYSVVDNILPNTSSEYPLGAGGGLWEIVNQAAITFHDGPDSISFSYIGNGRFEVRWVAADFTEEIECLDIRDLIRLCGSISTSTSEN